MKSKVIVLIAFILNLLTATTAGQKILYPEINPADARFDNIEIDNGRAGPTVYSIMQDSKGFIWCGTETGLYRYDGLKSVKYSYGSSDTTLAGYIVTCIYEETNGNIWAGTHGALNRINSDSRTISHFIPDTIDLSGPDNYVRLIRKDSKGRFWILTDRNVFRLDVNTSAFTRFFVDSLAMRTREEIIVIERDKFIEDINGNIWVATNNGLFKFKEADKSWKRVFPDTSDSDEKINPKVNCIKADNDGFWVGTEAKGLLRIDNPENGSYSVLSFSEKKQSGTANPAVSSLTTTEDGMVWFTTGNIISKLNSGNGEITKYLIRSKFPLSRGWEDHPRITSIFHGKNGELWFVDYANGLLIKFCTETEKISFYLVPRYIVLDAIRDNTGSFWFGCVANNIFRLVSDSLPYMTRNIPNVTSVSYGNFQNMAEDSTGNMFFVFSTGLYTIKNPEVSTELLPVKLDFGIEGLFPRCIFRDNRHNLWIGYDKGVIQKLSSSGRENRKFTLPGGPFKENEARIRIIREDLAGNMWVATVDKGIFRINKKENQFTYIIGYKEITGTEKIGSIMDFFVDRNSYLWLSVFDELFRIDPENKKIVNLTGFEGTGKTFPSMVCRIYEDRNKDVWLLNSLRGPFIYDNINGSFRKPFGDALIPDFGFFDIQFDNNGNLWLSDNDMIIVFDTLRRSRRNFPFQMNGYGVQSLVLKSGMVAYIINNKLILFPPKAILNKNIPPVYLTSLRINDKDYSIDSKLWQHSANLRKLDLRHDQNTLKIEFAALNYTFPELNNYRFIMDGIDRDTTYAGTNPIAVYRNLPPGSYKFRVTGSNNDGIWNPDGATLEIRIHPPWYKSVLAYIIYIILFITALFTYIKLRIYTLTRDKERLENEVRLRTEELEIKNRRLAETDRIKTHFFTDISHEIRTPLTMITGPLEILLKTYSDNSNLSRILSSMRRNADRLTHLVNELLDISRLDAGKMKIILEDDDIIRNLRMLVYEFLSMAESRHINYIAELPENSFITWFDSDKVNKIITNLLSNAFRYTPADGTVKCIVQINNDTAGDDKTYIKITISDTGRGIGKEHIDKIFERFYRVEGHHENNYHGTGIGLSMVREFIDLLHGEIDVDSTPGRGSVFTVKLPLGKDHLSPSEYVLSDKSSQKSGSLAISYQTEADTDRSSNHQTGNLHKILVIEDNADLREFISENLSDTYHLLKAENGKTGSGLAYSMMPDLILSDIIMPDTDGIQLCKKLKNDERTSHIPIILLTAKATTDDKLIGLKSGADDYIIKPFNMDELKTRISNLLIIREKLKLKYLDPKSLEKIEESKKSVDDRFMEKVIRLINENLNNFDFDVALLHNSLGMSRMHLSRKLKALTGMSPHLLINNMRLEKAAELLRLNKGNVTEISNSVGISNPANFSRAFREHFGTSPKNYLKQFRN